MAHPLPPPRLVPSRSPLVRNPGPDPCLLLSRHVHARGMAAFPRFRRCDSVTAGPGQGGARWATVSPCVSHHCEVRCAAGEPVRAPTGRIRVGRPDWSTRPSATLHRPSDPERIAHAHRRAEGPVVSLVRDRGLGGPASLSGLSGDVRAPS
jgi:hypothetical protein